MTGAEARLVRPLYRALLRLGHAFDREPTAKLLLHAQQTSEQTLYNAALSDFLGGNHRLYLAPEREVRLKDTVRKFFRLPLSDEASVDDRVEAAFVAVRELSTVWHQALTHIVSPRVKQQKDYEQAILFGSGEQQQQQQQEGEAQKEGPQAEESVTPLPHPVHSAQSLAPGVLLLAHPLIAGSIFQRSVILLIEHHSSRSEDESCEEEGDQKSKGTPRQKKGSYGLVVNKLSGFDLKHAVRGSLNPDFFKAFSACPVRLGGPVPRLQMLHRNEEVGGVVVNGKDDTVMLSGNVNQASGLVLSDKVPAEDFHFFAGASTWAPGQLEEEVEKGYWILVDAPPGLSVEFRPNLWREVLLGLGGCYKISAALPETVLPRLVEPPPASTS